MKKIIIGFLGFLLAGCNSTSNEHSQEPTKLKKELADAGYRSMALT